MPRSVMTTHFAGAKVELVPGEDFVGDRRHIERSNVDLIKDCGEVGPSAPKGGKK